MPFSRVDRKTALMQAGKSQRDVAETLGVDETLVSHVLAGRRWTGEDSQRVMRFLAELYGAPITEVFPGSDRRTGGDRRRDDQQSA